MVTMADWFWTTVGGQYSGTMNATLPALVATVNGGRLANGQAAMTLGGMTHSGVGSRAAVGTMTTTLGGMTSSANGSRDIKGTLAATLGGMTSSANGNRDVKGTLAATLGGMTSSIAGLRPTVWDGTSGYIDIQETTSPFNTIGYQAFASFYNWSNNTVTYVFTDDHDGAGNVISSGNCTVDADSVTDYNGGIHYAPTHDTRDYYIAIGSPCYHGSPSTYEKTSYSLYVDGIRKTIVNVFH